MVGAIRNGGAPLFIPPLAALLAVAVGAGVGLNPLYGLGAAVGIVFVLVVLLDPLVGLGLMVVLAFAATVGAGSSLSAAKFAGMVLAGAWLVQTTASRGAMRSMVARRPGFAFAIVLFLGFTTLSVVWAQDQGVALTSVSRYALNAILIPIVFAVVRSERDVVRLFGALLIGAIVAGASGVLSPPSSSDIGRASGTVGDANELAASLIIGFGVAAGFTFNRRLGPGARTLGSIAMALSFAGIVLSLSRGGLLGLGAMVAAAAVLGGRWKRPVAVGAVAVVLGAVFYFTLLAPPAARERISTASGGTGRVDLWTVGGRMVAAHPVLGVGTGQFQIESVHYLLRPGAIARQDFILTEPKVAHNTYLNIVAELGVVGGALFFGLLLASVVSLWRATSLFARIGNAKLELIARGLLCGVMGYLVAILFISENYAKLFWLLLAFGPMLLAIAVEQAHEHDERHALEQEFDDEGVPVGRSLLPA